MPDRRDITPPSRHFCSSPHHNGPRWLLSCYFYRHPTNRTGLQSYCITCVKVQMRAKNLSPKIKRKRYDYSREYKARQRRANGVPVRTLHNPRFDGKKLAEWLDERIVKREIVGNGRKHRSVQFYLNGVAMSQTDVEFVRHLRNGQIKFSTLQRVDELAVKYDLALWEIQEAAQRQRKDKRRKRLKKTA